jgi:hypothetical protein
MGTDKGRIVAFKLQHEPYCLLPFSIFPQGKRKQNKSQRKSPGRFAGLFTKFFYEHSLLRRRCFQVTYKVRWRQQKFNVIKADPLRQQE